MSTFKVNIVNLNDQKAGFFKALNDTVNKFDKDLEKYAELVKKKKRVSNRMNKQLDLDMKAFVKTDLYKQIEKIDQELRNLILKELNESIDPGIIQSGYLVDKLSKMPNLERLADGGDRVLRLAYNTAIRDAVSEKYPNAEIETFQQFAAESVNNKMREMYKGFKDEADKDTDKYSEIEENPDPTPEQLEGVFFQMKREKICFDIGLKYGIDICNKTNIEEQKVQNKKFKAELKEFDDAFNQQHKKLNELYTLHSNLIDKMKEENFGKNLNKETTDISQDLNKNKAEILEKLFGKLFPEKGIQRKNEQEVGGATTPLTKKVIYEELTKKYFIENKHRANAFTRGEGELDQEGGHYANDFEASIPDDVDVYGVTLSEVINSSNSSRRKSSKKRR